MKKSIILLILVASTIFSGKAQILENLDYVSDFNEGLAAVKKDKQWAFINANGNLVIDFREDLVATKFENDSYPVFRNGRCLIEKRKDGVAYYGYMDTTGKVVVEPQFLNASNYKNEVALALYLVSEELGKNNLLGKTMVNYQYFVVAIDRKGNIISYLTETGTPVVLDKKNLKNPPKINARLISETLCAVLTGHDKWNIRKIRE